jgi:tetratricopeptide (TPR) repeat protein
MRKRIALILLLTLMLLVPLAGQAQQATQEPAPSDQTAGVVAPELFETSTTALEAEDFDRAVLEMSLFLLLNPTFSQGYYVRALGYLGREDNDLALVDVAQALNTAPDFPQYQAALYALRASIHTQANELEDAVRDYSAAIDLNPNAELYSNRALVYISMEDYESALTDLDSAVEAAEDNPVLRIYRAFVHTRLENRSEAARDYFEFLQLIESRRVEHDLLTAGEPAIVTVAQGVIHEFGIEAERGQSLSLIAQARPGDNVDPLLVLLDEDGEVLAADDDSGGATNAAILGFELPSDGTYTVLVSHSLGGFDGQVAVAYEVTG